MRTGAERAQQEGFAEELPDELAPLRADGLPQPDFFRPPCGPRRGEVHEVDARQQEHEDGNRREEVDERDVAVRLQLGVEVGVQVDVEERLEVEPVRRLVADDAVLEVGELRFERGGVRALSEQEVGEGRLEPPYRLLQRGQAGIREEEFEGEVGGAGQFGEHARHPVVREPAVVEGVRLQHLAEGLLIGEVFLRHRGREDERVRLQERRRRIADGEWKGKHVEHRRIHKEEVALVEAFLVSGEGPLLAPPVFDEPNGMFDLGEGILQRRPVGEAAIGVSHLAGSARLGRHAVDPVPLFVEAVVGQFASDAEGDDEAARQPDGEARHVEERVAWMLTERAEGDDEVVLKHGTRAIRGGGIGRGRPWPRGACGC